MSAQPEIESHYDELTGISDRFHLQKFLGETVLRASSGGDAVILAFLGVDHFRLLNNSVNHLAGDELLKQVAERLRSGITNYDFLARLGGDEFAIVRVTKNTASDTANLCQEISDTFVKPFSIFDENHFFTCSIGVACYPNNTDDALTLFKYADMALQRAKELGRNNSQLFSNELNERTQERVTLENALRLAIEKNQLHLSYQPLVDLQTGKICGMEALARWNHEELGEIPTPRFIQIAEESGLIVDMGEWVIHQACHDIRQWLDSGLKDFCVAVNISSKQLLDPLLANKIQNAMAEMRISPELLSLEITETVLMQDTPFCVNALEKFKNLNLNLTLDDFGTGFSSLSYLKRFPFYKVKIDRSFVRDVVENADDAAICKAIVSMAHSLGIRVVALGVETEAQCSFLSQNMCDEIQGFLFSDALTPVEVDDILRHANCLPENLLRFQKPKRTILLVDDEQNIVAALRRLLRGGDYQILTANSGQGGLDILAQNAVDVIVSDQRMPGMTGVEFLGIAKKLYPDTVRIVLSGYTELHSVTDAVNEGAIYKFLTKPWDDEQLRGHIEEAFKRKEMADENRRLNLEVRAANQDLANANRRLEEILRQKQQQINRGEVSLDIVREALQQIPLAVVGVDDDDMVVFANDYAQVLFEHTASILGSDANQLIPDLSHAQPESNRKKRCMVELSGAFYEVISRSMGSGSLSRGKLITLSPIGEKA